VLQAVGSEILKTVELALGFELAVMVPPWSAMILRQMARPRPVPSVPLPLQQVQKIAGHKDIGTTLRYVHTDGIKNTGSRQWSRDHRKAVKAGIEGPEALPVVAANLMVPVIPQVKAEVESTKPRYGHLRVVNSSDS